MRRTHIAAFISLAISAAAPAHAQDAAAGENIFRKCAACHQVGEGAKNKVGPVLTDVIGRAAGSFGTYKYGRSMIEAGDAGLVWAEGNIFNYLFNPKDFLRAYLDDPKAKAKMTFRLKGEQDRLDVIAYLSSFAMAMAAPTNGFCVTNQSQLAHIFAVDTGGASQSSRTTMELAPGETLCTAEYDAPQNGFVSVFESAEHTEGCSRLVTNGVTEGMVKYADFDRCEWSSHSS